MSESFAYLPVKWHTFGWVLLFLFAALFFEWCGRKGISSDKSMKQNGKLVSKQQGEKDKVVPTHSEVLSDTVVVIWK